MVSHTDSRKVSVPKSFCLGVLKDEWTGTLAQKNGIRYCFQSSLLLKGGDFLLRCLYKHDYSSISLAMYQLS